MIQHVHSNKLLSVEYDLNGVAYAIRNFAFHSPETQYSSMLRFQLSSFDVYLFFIRARW